MFELSRLGETRNNKFGTPMKIIRYNNSMDVDVEFQDEFRYVKTTTYSNFKMGCVKNPYDRTLFGVGYIGVGKYMAKVNGKMTDEYEKWTGLIQRCYYDGEMFPAYCEKVTVCDEWHNFQNFAEWLEKNRYKVNERLHIDKDILFPNCMCYSPKTCLLVPQRINMLFMNKYNTRGLPNGIKKYKKGYLAKYGGEELGVYPTLERAYEVYASEKEKTIKRFAEEYKEIIPKNVYDALYAYKVDIKNDKNYVA